MIHSQGARGSKSRFLADLEEFELSKALTPTEYKTGAAHEQLSAESARRRVVAGQAGYAGVATAAGSVGGLTAGAKIAGTSVGQSVLARRADALRLGGKHDEAKKITQLKEIGAKARSAPGKTLAITAGASAIGALAGRAAQVRGNEEAGISQGVGRLKASTRYQADINRIGKNVRFLANLADEVDRGSPNVRRAYKFLTQNQAKVAGTSAAVVAPSATVYGAHRGKLRRREIQGVKSAVAKARTNQAEAERYGRHSRVYEDARQVGVAGGGLLGVGILGSRTPFGRKITAKTSAKITRANLENVALGVGSGTALAELGASRARSKHEMYQDRAARTLANRS